MIDAQGFRANVGIVLLNGAGQVFWGRRIGIASGWQFPQGGVNQHETLEAAMFRELREEVGLEPHHVQMIGCTRGWLRYRLPKRYIRHDQKPLCIGQKQRWYVLRLTADEGCVDLKVDPKPEFDQWRWIDYWESLQQVVAFKRQVYQQALHELAPLISEVGLIKLPPRMG
ncbi:MAG: RNA pyrophosphohydrolase [Gammaproteobacteria bacterium]|nr:RNA pyrophosphohydrolase [Gammaproteobacteria bacterium]